MSFLKTVGRDALIVFEDAAKIGEAIIGLENVGVSIGNPKVAAITNEVASDLEQLFQTVLAVQKFGAQSNMSGADKLKAAMTTINTQMLDFMQAHKLSVTDQQKWSATVQGFTAMLADFLLATDQIKAAGQTTAPAPSPKAA